MEPQRSNFDPIAVLYPDSVVETNVDNFFSLESIGVPEIENNVDDAITEKFENGIIFKDGKYQVDLPWIPDKINKVSSNFNVAKAVLNRVVGNLRANNQFEAYSDIFEDQLKDEIIEELDLEQLNPAENIWIPHRPVIKEDQQVTTKIRPVLNCSFKLSKTSTSINDAAYKGPDLMNNLLQFLFKIRQNAYLIVSDIMKAFLQIKLKSKEDRNKFSILWITSDNKLRAFRYTTIVFGFISSPFILQCVLNYHLSKYENDKHVSNLIKNFYVDNLFITGNNINVLKEIYRKVYKIMREGGFHLRSWFSNSNNLQELFSRDEVGTQHSASTEKILGYLYTVNEDVLQISGPRDTNFTGLTKRKFVSAVSSVFDPLGLLLVITVTGKILIREMWSLKLDWDTTLPSQLEAKCLKFLRDLSKLHELKLKRRTYCTDQPVTLIIFCDASKQAYCFVT